MFIEVRDAVRDDADAIADVHIASWRAGYRHIFPASILDADEFVVSRRSIWRGWTHSPTPDRRLVVATDGGRITGFAHSGTTDETGIDGESCGELFGFYTHPDTWGSGVAAALMTSAIEHLTSLGHVRAILWTFADATRSRPFYKKSGWVASGRTDCWDRYPDHPVPAVEYEREL